MKLMDSIYWQFEKRKYLRWLIPLLVCAIVVSVSVWGYIDHTRPDAKEDDVCDIDDLIAAYRNIPNGGILDVDHDSLSRLGASMAETKYRVCGVLTDIEERTVLGLYQCSAHLVVGEEDIYIFLVEDQSPVDGEYVEVVGRILSPGTRTSLTDCTITDRGSAVRDRLESEE